MSARPCVTGLLTLGAALFGPACRPVARPEGEAARPAVAASIFPLYDIARRVAGDRVAVELVLPPGRLDHRFDPRPRDLVRLSSVELAFGVGLGLDPWLSRAARAATDGRARVVELGPDLDPRPLPLHLRQLEDALDSPPNPPVDHDHGPLDPHVFLDPLRMAGATKLMASALGGRDPAGVPGYDARGEQVARELRALDQELRGRSARWAGRTIVTFHASFLYFADRYGLRVAAVVEALPGQEPSPRSMARILEAIRTSGARALFSEPQLDPRPARVIATESGLPLFELDPVGGGPGASTYEAWLLKNAAVLDEALP